MNRMAERGRPAHLKRVAWFVAIWAGGLLALGLIAWLFRGFMGLIGLGR